MIQIFKTTAQLLALIFIGLVTGYALFLIYGVLSSGEIAKLGNTEKLTLAISILSAFATLFAGYAAWNANRLSKSEAEANRKHSESLQMPYMIVIKDVSPEYLLSSDYWQNIIISIKNIGSGPLIIDRLDIHIDGQPVIESNRIRDGAPDFIKAKIQEVVGDTKSKERGFYVPINKWPVTLNALASGTGLAAGEGINIIEFPIRQDFAVDEQTKKIFKLIKINCIYKDIYGNKFPYGKMLDTFQTQN
ncbi:hypothetical protein [Marinomonas fungiae]|uniref:Uncharacterized protein n=1 Tax=Marinomonas fungiae TaxID=1137284 RepID=A0A0K6ILP6_9GAMM|nr:hypothetical protein [Marinomonas fungiae]CUB04014.1 hypothetical protein Ga0061065_105106 [Marinomonas fungiae]